ncbi:O-linked N-acetylglucosamine transferase, SPINDLY family protein [Magnetospirillum molischianum]|uniref:protein O-GlcNAc transferase n=1 Tax=Magnetospirillum molischianum DSM 120 TaxID=1150626 RepID=H8FP10_MAGML|nr:glycosyltransferase family 41 protein [Magnetospirillum molischianum]CCG40098.1 conserved hypothetical protein [Magnetospirillum molischianum DSM 120]
MDAAKMAEIERLAGQSEVLYRAGRLSEAEAACRRLAGFLPDHPMIHYNLARVLKDRGKTAPAAAALRRAVALAPEMAEAWLNLGMLLTESGRLDEAEAAFQSGLATRPEVWMLWSGLARIHLARGRRTAAESALLRALELAPKAPALLVNLGNLRLESGRAVEAAALFEQAVAVAPTMPEALLGAGNAVRRSGDPLAALDYYRRAVAVRPGDLGLIGRLAEARLSLCDWDGIERLRSDLVEPALAQPGPWIGPMQALTLPLTLTPSEGQVFARRRADQIAAEAKASGPSPRIARAGRRDRLTVGYLSADFHDHPTSHLMRGLFAAHDRAAVRVAALSLGPDDGSAYRRAVREGSDLFLDLAAEDNAAAAAAIAKAGIDILVDINVHTRGNRLALTALRPAPVAVNWLGLPGTSGASFIDWVIVDGVVAPPGAEAAFSESLLVLPHCYQPNDRTQPISPDSAERAAYGLPDGAFVFCCFNQAYKIEPIMFGRWMRILERVPDSVLWLLGDSVAMETNLRREAQARGIDPARLVFAAREPKPRHLARHRHAGLGLDTLFYNAHTTASDALWAGLPILTTPGEAFASRVGASLLGALGLPELICPDLDAYEEKAVALATDPAALATVTERLAAARLSSALFDTDRFARDLERGFRLIWDAACTGRRPRRLEVPA